eukprot:INCI15477.1.p1 GENE.INCI15477.1~~INCI15477.1.p1  ORF type:complete len:158 (+),score=37.17 INCI15477.1:68-541(+)
MSDVQAANADVQGPVRPKQLAFDSAFDNAPTQLNVSDGSAEKQAEHALGTPALDFLPRVSELFDLIAEANAGAAADRPMHALKETVKEKALDLRAQFTAARTFFATNKYLQMTVEELTELEQQREKERQRINRILHQNFEATWLGPENEAASGDEAS